MYRSMNVRPSVSIWFAALVAVAAIGASQPETVSLGVSAIWLAVCVVSASMIVGLRPGPAVTLAASLDSLASSLDHTNRRRGSGDLLWAGVQPTSDHDRA